MSDRPIGIFDSGIGGTSIFKEVHNLLPNENIVYLADSKNAPYGSKTQAKIIELSKKNSELLLTHNCKLIVVACNTATTNSIDILRSTYPVPFIGIEPAIKPAALQTRTMAVGILATKGTLASELFHKTTNLYGGDVKVIESDGKGIVELIERGNINSDEMRKLLLDYISPMLDADIDHLVLGCTHYPYLIPILKKMIPPSIKIIDSGLAVAKQTKAIILKNDLMNTSNIIGNCHFYTNGDSWILKQLLSEDYLVEDLDF